MTVSARLETIFLFDFNLGEKVANLFQRRRQLLYHLLRLTEITGLSGKLKHCPAVETRDPVKQSSSKMKLELTNWPNSNFSGNNNIRNTDNKKASLQTGNLHGSCTNVQKQKEFNNQGTQEKTVVNSQVVTILKKLCCQSFYKVLFGELKQTNC